MSKSYRDELDSVLDEMTDINHRLDRLYDTLETGKIGIDDLAPRIRELREHRERLLTRKGEIENLLSERHLDLANPEMVTEYVDDLHDLHDLLKERPLAERRAFIRSFVRDITVTADGVKLTYVVPLPPTGVSQEKVGVLPTVHCGGR